MMADNYQPPFARFGIRPRAEQDRQLWEQEKAFAPPVPGHKGLLNQPYQPVRIPAIQDAAARAEYNKKVLGRSVASAPGAVLPWEQAPANPNVPVAKPNPPSILNDPNLRGDASSLAANAKRVLGPDQQVGYVKPGLYGEQENPIRVTNEGPVQVVRGPANLKYTGRNLGAPAGLIDAIPEGQYNQKTGMMDYSDALRAQEANMQAFDSRRARVDSESAPQRQTGTDSTFRNQMDLARFQRDLARDKETQDTNTAKQYMEDVQNPAMNPLPENQEIGQKMMEDVARLSRQKGGDPYQMLNFMTGILQEDMQRYKDTDGKGSLNPNWFGSYDWNARYGEAWNALLSKLQ